MNASFTKNNTILIDWKYQLENCDKGFVVYWSSKRQVSKSTESQEFLNHKNVTSFEIKNLGNGTKKTIFMYLYIIFANARWV